MKKLHFKNREDLVNYIKSNKSIKSLYTIDVSVPESEVGNLKDYVETKLGEENMKGSKETTMKINKAAMVKKITKFEELKNKMNADRYIPNNAAGLGEVAWDVAVLKETVRDLLDLLDEMVKGE